MIVDYNAGRFGNIGKPPGQPTISCVLFVFKKQSPRLMVIPGGQPRKCV